MALSDIIPGKEIYDDAFSPAMKQFGDMLESTIKVVRFLTAPVEYAAAFQDRWQRYLKKIADRVSDKNLVEGQPQIIVTTLEGLSLVKEDSLLCELFLNLLANSIDVTKQDLAHPAFPNILKQLSHDEAVILYLLKKGPYKYKMVKDVNEGILYSYARVGLDNFPVDKLNFPQHIVTYNDHLHSLNLTSIFKNDNYKLNSFGQLFAQACIPDKFEEL